MTPYFSDDAVTIYCGDAYGKQEDAERWIDDALQQHFLPALRSRSGEMSAPRKSAYRDWYTLALDTEPKEVCARCSRTRAEARGWKCQQYGQPYEPHDWIWWKPAETEP